MPCCWRLHASGQAGVAGVGLVLLLAGLALSWSPLSLNLSAAQSTVREPRPFIVRTDSGSAGDTEHGVIRDGNSCVQKFAAVQAVQVLDRQGPTWFPFEPNAEYVRRFFRLAGSESAPFRDVPPSSVALRFRVRW